MARIILHGTRVLAHVKNPHPKGKQCPCACGLHSSYLVLPLLYTPISCITHGTFLHLINHLPIAQKKMCMFNLRCSSIVLVNKSFNSNLIAAPLFLGTEKKVRQLLWRSIPLLHVTHTAEQRNAQPAWSLELLCTLLLDHIVKYAHVAHHNA